MTSSKKDEQQNQAPVKYYGKKTYLVHPLLAQRQLPETKTANYHNENLIEKSSNIELTEDR